MTDKTQPEALRLANEFKLCNEYDSIPSITDIAKAAAELLRQHDRIAELEAELEAVGAGGVQALSAAPAGWKLVPVEPTQEMLISPSNAWPADAKVTWAAMLAASPTPPAEQQAPKETLGGVNGWRDISTAPKDGSRFVAIGYNYGLYSEGRHICVAQWFRGCWMEASDWNEASELKHLTHWLPLPSPPDNAAELNDLDVSVSPQQAAPKAAPGEREQAAQRLRELAGVSENDVADPLHPRYIEGYKAGHAAGRKRAAPQQEAQRPWGYAWRQSPFGWGFCSKQAYEQAAGRGEEVAKLYTAPQPKPAPLSDDTERLREALQRIEGASMSMYATRSDMLEHCQDIARAALAAQGGNP